MPQQPSSSLSCPPDPSPSPSTSTLRASTPSSHTDSVSTESVLPCASSQKSKNLSQIGNLGHRSVVEEVDLKVAHHHPSISTSPPVTLRFHIPPHLEFLSYLPESLRESDVRDTHYGIPGFLSLVFGAWTDKGPRMTMEDSHIECGDLLNANRHDSTSTFFPLDSHKAECSHQGQQHLAYVGVFDGHRGWRCANHAKVI